MIIAVRFCWQGHGKSTTETGGPEVMNKKAERRVPERPATPSVIENWICSVIELSNGFLYILPVCGLSR
jgi:hypothetical protein